MSGREDSEYSASPTRALDVDLSDLLSGIAYLSGGVDKAGHVIITIPTGISLDESGLQSLACLLKYYVHVAREDPSYIGCAVYVDLTETDVESRICILLALQQFQKWYVIAVGSTLGFVFITAQVLGDCKTNALVTLIKSTVGTHTLVSGYKDLTRHAAVDQRTEDLKGTLLFDQDIWAQWRLNMEPFFSDCASCKRRAEARLGELRMDGPPKAGNLETFFDEVMKLKFDSLITEGTLLLDRIFVQPVDPIPMAMAEGRQFCSTKEKITSLTSTLKGLIADFSVACGVGASFGLPSADAESKTQELENTPPPPPALLEVREISGWICKTGMDYLAANSQKLGHTKEQCEAAVTQLEVFCTEHSEGYITKGMRACEILLTEDDGSGQLQSVLVEEAKQLQGLIQTFQSSLAELREQLDQAKKWHRVASQVVGWATSCLEMLVSSGPNTKACSTEAAVNFLDTWLAENPIPSSEQTQELAALTVILHRHNFFHTEAELVRTALNQAQTQLQNKRDTFMEVIGSRNSTPLKLVGVRDVSPGSYSTSSPRSPEACDDSDCEETATSSSPIKSDLSASPSPVKSDLSAETGSPMPELLAHSNGWRHLPPQTQPIDLARSQSLRSHDRKRSRTLAERFGSLLEGEALYNMLVSLDNSDFADTESVCSSDFDSSSVSDTGSVGSGHVRLSSDQPQSPLLLSSIRHGTTLVTSPSSTFGRISKIALAEIAATPSSPALSRRQSSSCVMEDDVDVDTLAETDAGDGDGEVDPHVRKQRLLMKELITSEVKYIEDLDLCIREFIDATENDPMKPGLLVGKRNIVFGNIERIYEHNKTVLLPAFQALEEEPLRMGSVFVQNDGGFGLYSVYFKNMPQQEELVTDCLQYWRTVQIRCNDPYPLNSYLIKPFQRMTRYRMFIEGIQKHLTQSAQCEQYREELRAAHWIVSFHLRHGNDLLALDRMKGFDGNPAEQGMLLRQDDFMVVVNKQFRQKKRRVFLFEDMILLAKLHPSKSKKQSEDTYHYKDGYRLSDITLAVAATERKFEICVKKHLRVVFQTENEEIKQGWTADIHKLLFHQAARLKERMAHVTSGIETPLFDRASWSHTNARASGTLSSKGFLVPASPRASYHSIGSLGGVSTGSGGSGGGGPSSLRITSPLSVSESLDSVQACRASAPVSSIAVDECRTSVMSSDTVTADDDAVPDNPPKKEKIVLRETAL